MKYTIQEKRRNKRTGKKAKNQPNSAGLLGQGRETGRETNEEAAELGWSFGDKEES